MGKLAGELSTFTTAGDSGLFGAYNLAYFSSGDLASRKAVIFIGGLTNGLGDVPFCPKLSEELQKIGWKLVQMHWNSAYEGFGTGSLDRDRDEMEALVKHLRAEGHEKVVLLGHSTGSQDVIHYLSSPPSAGTGAEGRAKVDGGIMQGCVSDREHLVATNSTDWLDCLPIAEKMIAEGKGDQILPPDACKKMGMKITAYRTWSLIAVGGDDDYFSSDIPAEDPSGKFRHPLRSSFGNLSAPGLAMHSEKDECGPKGDRSVALQKWVDVSNGQLEYYIIPGAGHQVKEADSQVKMCEAIVGWLQRVIEA